MEAKVFVTRRDKANGGFLYKEFKTLSLVMDTIKNNRIAITGLNGVIGRILVRELPKNITIIDLYHTKPFSGSNRVHEHAHCDLMKKDSISSVLESVTPTMIIHMAAMTHIDACEDDKKNGKNGIVWKTNVQGTHEIAKFCAKHNIPLIFISTECVFDGKKEFFDENEKKNPINWYGTTKNEAEEQIFLTGAPASIIRSVVAYHEDDENKTLYGKMLQVVNANNILTVVNDQLFTPTYTYDIVGAIKKIVNDSLQGIFHVAPKNAITPYEFARLLVNKHHISESVIKRTTLQALYGTERALLRLKNSSLLANQSSKRLSRTPKNPHEVIKRKKLKRTH
jgi:dTDP-4-dehydrorhamnose reductase